MRFIKAFLTVFIVVLICSAVSLYFFRVQILEMTAETLIKKSLPETMRFRSINFDFEGKSVHINSLAIRNTPSFTDKDFARVGRIIVSYDFPGRTFLDGIRIAEIRADDFEIFLERNAATEFNFSGLSHVMKPSAPVPQRRMQVYDEKTREWVTRQRTGTRRAPRGFFDFARYITFTGQIALRGGNVSYLDNAVGSAPFRINFTDVTSNIHLEFDAEFSRVEKFDTTGFGHINKDKTQTIKWKGTLYPAAAKITLSSRIEASGLDIVLAQPYYDKYSPILVSGGKFSGTLVFDVDKGNLGAMGDLKLNGLKFTEKQAYKDFDFWGTSLPDIQKYLTSAPDEVAFDFRIKGDMEHPKFYPGPTLKKAIQKMVVDKISDMFSGDSNKQKNAATGATDEKQSDADKVISAIKNVLDKQK